MMNIKNFLIDNYIYIIIVIVLIIITIIGFLADKKKSSEKKEKPSKEQFFIFRKYITRNGKRIYPKSAKVFRIPIK